MPSPQEAVNAYMSCWNETDEDRRAEILESCWTEDGIYMDPSNRVEGRKALVKHIDGYVKTFADHKLEATTGVDAHDGYLRFGWHMLDPSGSQIMEGVDFGTYEDDGRIALIVGFFGPWPDNG